MMYIGRAMNIHSEFNSLDCKNERRMCDGIDGFVGHLFLDGKSESSEHDQFISEP